MEEIEAQLSPQSPYHVDRLVNSQVSCSACDRNTRGLSHTGAGMRENAYGPASGGRVTGRMAKAGPLSGFTKGRPGDGLGRATNKFLPVGTVYNKNTQKRYIILCYVSGMSEWET